MKKVWIAVFILVLTAFGIIGYKYFKPTANKSLSSTNPVSKNVRLAIDFGNGKTISYGFEYKEGQTPFSLLEETLKKENVKYETKQYDFGVFVKSVNGLESTAEKSWIYFVNGSSGDIAADKKTLNPDDLVEWKYIKPTP